MTGFVVQVHMSEHPKAVYEIVYLNMQHETIGVKWPK